MAVEHEALLAVQPKPVARARRGRRDAVGAVLGAFVDRERDNRLARCDRGEPAAGLRSARFRERGDRADAGRQEGRRGQVAADFLEHDARLHMPHAETAMFFGNEHAGQSHLGELRPEVAREAGGVSRARLKRVSAPDSSAGL